MSDPVKNLEHFVPGQTYWHKTGGPKLVCVSVWAEGNRYCGTFRWWDQDNGEFHTGNFYVPELTDQAPTVSIDVLPRD